MGKKIFYFKLGGNMLRYYKVLLLVSILLLALLTGSTMVGAQDSETFVYWGGLIFSEDANDAFVAEIEEWGEARGVDVEVVMINQNETVQNVSAAIEAGTMPDALDLGRDFMVLLAQRDQLVDLTELYEQIGEAHGGWLESVDTVLKPAEVEGVVYGIPYAASGINIIHRRIDALEAAGFTEAPTTWEEMAEQAVAAQEPPTTYGMGFALSNVGDANLTTTMLHAWGGRVADEEGLNCTLDSEETRAFLEWITGVYEDGLFPAGATTWDGAGDNTAYLSGNAIFIANPGSVYLNMRDNDPELLEASGYSALPGGPVERIVPVTTVVRSIPATTSPEKQELAMDLFAYLSEDEFMEEYMNNAIYGPALMSQTEFEIFAEGPVHVGLADAALNGQPDGYPDVSNAAYAEYQTNFSTPRMIQRIVVDGLSIDESIAETQAACQAIYDKQGE
jgi:multiple sugar transport system substrate-binding protein